MNLKRRIASLEAGGDGGLLSPAARRWLGLPLTRAENAQADREIAQTASLDLAAVAADPDISTEVKQWLGAI